MIINLGLDSSGPSFKLQNKTVSPELSTIEVTYDANYEGLKSVKVRGVDATIDANIIPENIKEGVSILGVSGEYAPLLENVIATPRTTSQVITPSTGYDAINNLTINGVTADIDSNIKQENIRIGKSILSVAGAYDIKPDAFATQISIEVNLKQLFSIVDFSDVDMSNISTMSNCFGGCTSLQSITLPNNMTAVTDMGSCFAACRSLQSVTLPSSMSKVTNMGGCFQYCTSLKSITLPSSMTAVTNMSNCFGGCTSLQSVTLPSSMSEVTNMSCCFVDSWSLTSIIMPSSMPAVTNMADCFEKCSSLRSITLPSDMTQVTNMGWCFCYDPSLVNITLPSSLLSVNIIQACFYGCTSLENIDGIQYLPSIPLTNWSIDTCNLLNVSSLNRIIAALPTLPQSVTSTCTLGTTNLNKLTPEEIAVATNKGWTLN